MAYYEVVARQAPRVVQGGRGRGSGLGWVEAIAAILGPIVEGGASIYATTIQQKQAKGELKQRKAEYQGQQAEEAAARAAQERQYVLAQQGAIQQAQIARAYAERNWPYIVAAVGLGALAIITVVGVRAASKRATATRKKRSA